MNSATPIVQVVDDDESFRTAMVRLLRAAGHAACGYASAGEFLVKAPQAGPGCVVLDIQMPGPSGLELQEAIAKLDDPLPIIFISGHGNIPASVRAMKAGAVDFLTKPVKREILLKAIEDAFARDRRARAARADSSACRRLYERLTPREREVLGGVVQGKMNKEIAADLGIAERTVKVHRGQVMQKMGATSVPDLVCMAERLRGPAASDTSRPQA